MAREVFISYRKEDKDSAERICGALERDKIKCWIAPRDVPVGREWAASIVAALKQCSSFVVVLSSNSKNAKQIAREAELADNVGLPIITVRVEDVEPPPELQYFLGNIQWLDAFGANFDSAIRRLADVVRTRAAAPAPLHESAAAAASASTGSAAAPAPARTHFESPPASRPPLPESASAVAPASRSAFSRYVIIGAVVLVVVVGIALWSGRKPSAPPPNNDAAAARAFGIDYMKVRDSEPPARAYSMTGPAFQKRWTPEKFAAAVEGLGTRAKVTGYEPDRACTERERGAYGCDYTISYANGKQKKDKLTVAKRENGWAIAGDSILGEQ